VLTGRTPLRYVELMSSGGGTRLARTALVAVVLALVATALEAVPHQGHTDSFDRHCLACQILPGTVTLGAEACEAVPALEGRPTEPNSVLLPGCLHRPERIPQRGPPNPA
jgi:hypothetical protein